MSSQPETSQFESDELPASEIAIANYLLTGLSESTASIVRGTGYGLQQVAEALASMKRGHIVGQLHDGTWYLVQ